MKCTNSHTRLTAVLFGAVLVLGAVPVLANPGAGVAITPNFPAVTSVGDSFGAELSIFNTSDPDVPELTVNHIHLNVSCANIAHPCPSGDAGVFDLGATGIGSLACAGVTFAIADQGNGLYSFVPDAEITLERVADGGQPCVIAFDVTTIGLPAIDANPGVAGIQTRQVAHTLASGFSDIANVVEEAEGLGSDTTTVQFNPEIDVTKDCVDVIGANGEITFSGTITNVGNVTLTNVTLVDSHAGVIVLVDTELAPGESVAYSGSYLPPNGEPIINTVTASGDYAVGGMVGSVQDEASDECQQLIPMVDLEKDCLPREFGAEDNNIDINVTNTGEVALTGCVVTDTLAGFGSDPFDLAVGASVDFDIAATGFGEDTLNTASVICGVVGSDITVEDADEDICEVPLCEVALDKQISCNGGMDWVDVGFGDSIAEACIGWTAYDGNPGSEVLVRYVASNTGDVNLLECSITESNPLLYAGVVGPFDLPPGGAGFEWTLEQGAECSADLAAGEPDTAMINCECAGFGPDAIVSDSDSADFECQTPDLQVTKICDPELNDSNEVRITVSNTGEFDLAECSVVDTIYLDDPSCPADMGDGTLVESFELFNLAAGASVELNTAWADLMSDACNTVVVECDVVGAGGATISATADDVCETAEGCLTRTGGFWGTHPHIADLFLPVNSCGIELDTTVAWTNGSTTEDICISGQDAKQAGTSMQQLQLIRQCTVAQLNIETTLALEGSCTADYPGLADMMQQCCADVCTGEYSGSEIGASGCIEWLDAFNNSEDTLDAFGTPFQSPGPAQPGECKDARGNGFVNERDLGPGSNGNSNGGGRPFGASRLK